MLDLRACGQSDVMSAERRWVFGDLWLSHFFQSREEKSQCGWCVVSGFASFSPSLFFLRVSVLVCWIICLLLIWLCCWEICLLYNFSLLIGSNWVFFVFYFEGHGLAKKLLLIIFFLDKFHWHFAMHWSYVQKPLFPFWRQSQHWLHLMNALAGTSCHHYFVCTIN